MFWESTLWSLQNDINISVSNDELFNKSSDFLMSKLDEYNKSDNWLSDTEIDNIEAQLEYHLQLKELHQDFQSKKNKMRDNIKQNLSISFTDLQDSIISETHISEIDDILEQDLFDEQKWLIDDNLNVIGWFSWFFDSIDNTDTIQDFIDYFTLSLLNDNLLIKGNNIDLSLKELNKYLVRTINLLINKNLEVPDLIELSTSNWIIEFNLRSIIDEIIEQREIERIRLEKERSKQYNIEILNKLLLWSIDDDEKDFLSRKYSFEYKNNDWENKELVRLLNDMIEVNIIDSDFISDLYEKKTLSRTILLNYYEQFKDFNYLSFLEQFWLTEWVQKLWLNYVRNILHISVDDLSDKEVLKNLEIFIVVFLHIESSWRNISNVWWSSSAEWYFQFLTGNWRYNEEKQWLGSSFQTWLTRTRRNYISQENDENEFNLRFWKEYKLNANKQDPKNLSAENQTILFFSDITANWRSIWNTDISEFMKLIFTETNSWALWRIYKVLHHTDPDLKTKKVFEDVKNQYFYWNKKLIAQNHY